MGDGRPSRDLPSLKIRERSNEKWGEIRGPILGFQITDNYYAQMNRKDARSFLSENRVLRTSISILFLKPVGEPMGPLTSAGP